MKEIKGVVNQKPVYIGADIPLQTKQYPIRELLEAFSELTKKDSQTRLALTGKFDGENGFSVWNYLDERNLTDRVDYSPYYERCSDFPVKKRDCAFWVDRDTPKNLLTCQYLQKRLSNHIQPEKYALIVTPFHPDRHQGNSSLTRVWLDHLRLAGYRIHLIWYMYDLDRVSEELRSLSQNTYEIYREVTVSSKLTGKNISGLNFHVDDWCGPEVLSAVDDLTQRFEYDVAIANYAIMSAVFERTANYTQKILITHDAFTDRNRKMLKQGYPESSWISLDFKGEKKACDRSDIVVAVQESEGLFFLDLVNDPDKIKVISPIYPVRRVKRKPFENKINIGYFGSHNGLNEANFAQYFKLWMANSALRKNSRLLIAGGVCDALTSFVNPLFLKKTGARLLGRFDDLNDFYAQCDCIINPERGGTGIKIKTLETLAAGMPLLSTKFGTFGLDCHSRFHQATDFNELIELSVEVATNPSLLEKLANDTDEVYRAYIQKYGNRMKDLLGPTVATSAYSINGPITQNPREILFTSEMNENICRNAISFQDNRAGSFQRLFRKLKIFLDSLPLAQLWLRPPYRFIKSFARKCIPTIF